MDNPFESLDDPAARAVLRNPDGTVQFPSRVPPSVDFPTTPGHAVPELLHHSAEPLGQSGNDGDPVASELPPEAVSTQEKRPRIKERQWVTERPPARTTSLPKIRRYNTNTSALDAALWGSTAKELADDDSTSSSWSSDSDQNARPPKKAQDDEGKVKRDFNLRHRNYRKTENTRRDSSFGRFKIGNESYKTQGEVSKKDGRLNISVNETNRTGYLAKALGATFMSGFKSSGEEQKDARPSQGDRSSSNTTDTTNRIPRPKLNIVVMVIGSRGDIQPFLRLGKILKEKHGHRVRIATHPAFRDFVQEDSGLEFFSVGGDPAELMAFMVKNPGMIPKVQTFRDGEIGRRRSQMAEMFDGFWRACINATDDEHDTKNLKMMEIRAPFIADVIIANPPSFAHVHCAERLGIPLHLMFTFPYTPTQAFPHPLANIKSTNIDPGYTNFMSYPLVEMMTWQGLGDLVNSFRVKTLGLEPVSTLWAPGQLYRLKVPYTYLWSPGLVPKPKDWGPEIDIAGFVFLDLASTFEPPQDLVKFLDAGEPPIYLGFGSIVVDDPERFTQMIFDAVKEAGVRALVSKGWGGLGGDGNVPEGIYMLENTPHDWLFPQVAGVIHHGGAGTTAIGLKCGKPTMIVPFFGDQMFWGNMIANAGAGVDPIPYKKLTKENLAAGIKKLLTKEVATNAEKLAADIEAEGDGAENAVDSFHRSLTLRGEHSLRCSILEDLVAVWNLKGTNLRLSALAADILIDQTKVTWKQLRLIRHAEYNDFEGPGEPLTGGATAMMGTAAKVATGIGGIPFSLAKSSKRRQRHEAKKKKKKSEIDEKSNSRHGTSKEQNSIDQDRKSSTSSKPKSDHDGASEDETRMVEQNAKKSVTNAKTPNPEPTTKNSSEQSIKAPDSTKNSSHLGKPSIPNDTTGRKPIAETVDTQTKASDAKSQNASNTPTKPLERADTNVTNASNLSPEPEQNAAEEIIQDVGDGVTKSGEAIVKAPMDLSLAVAQGFHNAPRLYGDNTVRRPTRITGIQSGLKAAGSEFVYGVYDGFTGVVTLPYRGAREQGFIGFGKGVGMGLTGLVVKNLSAVVGPFAYTMQGLHKEYGRRKQPTHFIRKARIMQGQRDFKELNPEERKVAREKVAHGWTVVQDVRELLEDTKRDGGVTGRVKMLKERRHWKASGAFENVEMAEKALKAKREGRGLSEVFEEQKREVENGKRAKEVL